MPELPASAAATPGFLPPARPSLRHRLRELRARLRGVSITGRPTIGRGVVFAGPVELGDGCAIGDGCRLLARGGPIRIGRGALLGERCVLVAHAGIDVGERCMLGDRAVILDFDHAFDDIETPVRLQAVRAEPVRLGAGARVGHEAAVLRGVALQPGAAVDARAVVTR